MKSESGMVNNVCYRLVRIHPYQLRHFSATTMLNDGAKLEVVSRLLGHRSIAITGDVYRHIDAEELDKQRKHGALNGFDGGTEAET